MSVGHVRSEGRNMSAFDFYSFGFVTFGQVGWCRCATELEQWRQMSFVSIVVYEAYCPPPFTGIFQNNSAFFDLFLLLGKHRRQFYVQSISTKESSPFHRYRSIFCFIAWFETTRRFKSDKLRNERSTRESQQSVTHAHTHTHLWTILIRRRWKDRWGQNPNTPILL